MTSGQRRVGPLTSYPAPLISGRWAKTVDPLNRCAFKRSTRSSRRSDARPLSICRPILQCIFIMRGAVSSVYKACETRALRTPAPATNASNIRARARGRESATQGLGVVKQKECQTFQEWRKVVKTASGQNGKWSKRQVVKRRGVLTSP